MRRKRHPFTVSESALVLATFLNEQAARYFCLTWSQMNPGTFELSHPTGLIGQYRAGVSTPEFVLHHRAAFQDLSAPGRTRYRVVDATKDARKPCFEIRHADSGFLSCYAADRAQAVAYAEGTLRGVVVA